jgi:hypothetical protein
MEIIKHTVLIDIDSTFETLSNKQVAIGMESKLDSFESKLYLH